MIVDTVYLHFYKQASNVPVNYINLCLQQSSLWQACHQHNRVNVLSNNLNQTSIFL